MRLLERFKWWSDKKTLPLTARHGQLGERAAKKHLQKCGLKYLTANFSAGRGEIDLIFREDDCLVFVEVKARAEGGWLRPAATVNARKRLLLTKCAFDYLRLLKTPPIKIRFDIVEVLLDGDAVAEIRHLPNTFTLSAPYRYG
jgi:putative endonuclease